jgi:sorting nexin-29
VEDPTLEEFRDSLKNLKNNKAPGTDNIPVELLKYGGNEVMKSIYELIILVWVEEQISKEWCKSIIFPIHKKGDKLNCSNYRGLALLCAAYKVLINIIRHRLEPYVQNILGEYQGGFRAERSTTDQLFTVKQILEKCWEFNINVYQIYIDFKQAYDSIQWEKLYKIMHEFNIPHKLIRLVRATIKNSEAQVKIQAQLKEPFKIKQGLKQGDGLAPSLFNLALEYAIRKLTVNVKRMLEFQATQVVGYADDMSSE